MNTEQTTPNDETQSLIKRTDFQSQIKFIEGIIDNMKAGGNKRIMITGDTGLGKTTFVKQFAKVLGMPIVIVEIPHIVEEHLINIPFVIFDNNGKSSDGIAQVPKPGVSLELGKSYLVSTLEKLKKLDNGAYRAAINTYDLFLRTLIEQYEQLNPGEIDSIRQTTDRILFFDEYYRQTSPSIRNILRGLTNSKIGNDALPGRTYVMYASNLSDLGGSIDPQSQHTSFIHKDFQAPTAEQWLNFTIGKALNSKINIKAPVVDAFKKHLTNELVSFNDKNNDVRTSPRRWSEVFHYINNAYPFENADFTSILKTTIERQFKGEDNTLSAASTVLKNIIDELTVSSGIDLKKIKPVKPGRWRDVLRQNVQTAIEVGDQKKYIPVLQGPPGTGKTAIGVMFEKPPYNLRFIAVDSTTISQDSLPGTPLPNRENGEVSVNFAPPELYIRIIKMMDESLKDYAAQLREEEANGLGNARERWNEFQNQKFKYMIFFDEINRVSGVAVYNSLRRLILEKEFNNEYRLTEESLVLAAMNPGDLNTQPMTSHFRDAIDLIDVEANWGDTLEFIKTQTIRELKSSRIGRSQASIETALVIIESFEKTFTHPAKEFHIDVGGNTRSVITVYFSPRDYDELFKELAAGFDRELFKIDAAAAAGKEIDDNEVSKKLIAAALDKIGGAMNQKFHQAEINAPNFMSDVEMMLEKTIDDNMKKKTKVRGLDKILMDSISNVAELKTNSELIAYLASYVPTQFADDFRNFCRELYGDTRDLEGIEEKNQKLLSVYKEIEAVSIEKDYGIDITDQVSQAFEDYITEYVRKYGNTHGKEIGMIAWAMSNTHIKIGD